MKLLQLLYSFPEELLWLIFAITLAIAAWGRAALAIFLACAICVLLIFAYDFDGDKNSERCQFSSCEKIRAR